jgi:transposase
MKKIVSQEAYFRKRFLKYCKDHGATQTAIRYKISRKTVYKWLNRFDGTVESLQDRSKRPHNSPKEHTEQERKLCIRMLKKVKWTDKIFAYQMLLSKGYSRSYAGFIRFSKKIQANKPKPKVKRKPKPYQRAEYPGQKVQIDVKFVPSDCIVDGNKYYVWVAKDECTRWTYRQMYNEHSTYCAFEFLKELVSKCPFPIKRVQTDNGTEFTNSLLVTKSKHKTMFEQALVEWGIEYQRIRIATPRHNGKVERQNRTDGVRFYKYLKMFNLEDGRKQLAIYQEKSNNIIMTCLGMKSPNEVMKKYLSIMF